FTGTIFAYGQTSSGKTFTMMGSQSSLGVIPLAIQDIFKTIDAVSCIHHSNSYWRLRLKEGCNINRSLFVIGQVIKKLSDGHAGGFINYRDSKLTRILQNSLGGNAKTVIICTITPATIEETLSTLQFASTAKHMKNDPHVNEVLDDEALMKRYRNEIVDLKKRLEEVFSETRAQATEKIELAQLLLEKEQLQREQEDRIKNLTKMIITSDFSKKEQKIKNKRRVTWAPGKLRDSLQSSGGFKFDGLPTSEPFVKRMKCEMSTLAEFDDSDCTEIEDSWSHTLDDPFELDASRNVAVRRSRNAYSTLSEEYPLFDGQESAFDVASPQMDDKEAKIANLERQLQSERNEKVQLTGMRSFLEKRVSELEQQLQSQTGEVKGAEHEEVKRVLDERIADLERQLLEKELEQEYVGKGLEERILELEQQHSTSKEEYTESKAALEKRIMELEHSLHIQENQGEDNLQDQLEKLLSEMDVLRDACDNMTLENEGLRNEKKELQFKLKEKNEMHEFEALEKEVRHEHEADLMHEITSLKAGTENAEVCIQGLKAELSQAKELIADLQSSVDKDLVEQIHQLRHSLEDAETVTRDTKKESAILRSENLEMKEKMDEMTVKYQQMEKDMLTSCSQLEAEKLRYKNMQTDLQKELQQAFNENTKLTTLLDGKVPKDLIERIELERRVADLKKELKQTFADKTALKEEVDASSALQHLPEKVAGLMKQVCRVTNELCIVTSEREGLISKIAEKDSRIHELTEAAKQASEKLSETVSKLNDAEMKVVDLTQQLSEVQQLLQSTQNCEIKAESESLIADKEQLLNDLQTLEMQLTTLSDELKQKSVEVSGLQSEKEALTESLDRLNVELELRTNMSQLERMEQGNKLQQLRGEMEALNQEKDCLQQVLETVRSERDALTNVQQDLEKTMTDLCNTREELNQTQQLVGGLNNQIEEKEAQLASMEERLVERKLSECVEKEVSVDTLGYSNLLAEKEDLLQSRDRLAVEVQRLQEELNTSTSRLACMERDALEQTCRLQHLHEKMATTTQARDELHQKLEVMQLNTEAVNQVTEELKLVTSERDILLAERRDTGPSSETDLQMEALQERISSLVKERDELQEILEGVRTEKNQLKADMQENIELAIETQEELRQQQQLVGDLKNQIASRESELLEKLNQVTEELKLVTGERNQFSSLALERDELQETLKSVRAEMDQLRKTSEEILSNSETQLKHQQQVADEFKSQVAEKEAQISSLQHKLAEQMNQVTEELKLVTRERDRLAEKRDGDQGLDTELQLGELQEQISSLTKERDELQEILESVRAENNQNVEMASKKQDELRSVQEELRQQQQLVNQVTEELKLVTGEQNQLSSLTMERDKLQGTLKSVTAEMDQLRKTSEEIWSKSETQLKHQQQVVEEFKSQVSEKAAQISSLQHKLAEQLLSFTEELKLSAANQSHLMAENLSLVQSQERLNIELEELRTSVSRLERIELEALEHEKKLSQFQGDMATLTQERDELQKTLDHLQVTMSVEKRNIELDCMQSFHKLKDQFESWFSNMDTILLNDFGSQKELVSQLLSPLSSAQTKPVEILNSDIQRMNLQFKFVLKKLKFLYTALAQNQMEHHQLTAQFEMDCYEENKKQELLVKKIKFLTDNGSTKYNDQCETERFNGLLEKRDLQLQEIRQILSELEHIFIKTDTELQQELKDREKLKLKLMALDSSSIPDLMEILSQEKTRIKQHVELLSQAQKSLALKFTDFDKKRKSFRFQSNKQLEEEKKKSETLIQQLDSLTNVVPNSGAALLLQEENQRLLDKLGANEMEIKAKVKKGEAPYTEELERLKTKVVKMEFERTVLSRTCQQEIDSLKATLDLKEDNLRSLREKLRRMQQDHDETMHEDHRNQHPIHAGPLSCGSDFGIVQSTAVLVMKAEKAKLEAEVHQLKKKNDHLDSIVLNLQDEVSKWKVRARKLKDSSKAMHSLTDLERHSECLPLSPVKQQVSVPHPPSPRRKLASSELVLRKLASSETLVLNSPKSKFFDSQPDSMSVSRPTPFFDNSSLGMVPGLEPPKEAGSETQDWWASAPRKNDTVSECKTQ
ncbi:UNVERIFIED_CONTAM: hypothetical protein FKN15_011581, partial [Acipenser sinensis]